jgi:hypothetical protein
MPYRSEQIEAKKTTISIVTATYNTLLFISAILTAGFISHIAKMADHFVWAGEQYAPETYGGILALIVCAYIWAKARAGYQRYIAAVLMSMLIVGYAIWLIGKSGLAGRYYLQTGN